MIILFFLTAFISEVAGTIAGFGSSTIFLPLALLFVDFKTALTLVALFHIFGNFGRIGFFRHGLDKKMLVTFGIPSIIFTAIGALLVTFVSQTLLKSILGIFLVIYSLIALWKNSFSIKQSLLTSALGGGISGFLAGLIGTGGALRGAFLTGFGLSKEKYIATTAAIALLVDFTRIPVYFTEGFLSRKYYWFIPILLLIALIASFLGKTIIEKIPQKKFKTIVLASLFIIGVYFILG